MQTADPKLYASVTAKLDPEKKGILDEAVKAFEPLVEAIESNPVPTTKNNYGPYLSYATTPMEIVVLILAGANRVGVMTAAKINGVNFK